MKIGRTLFDFNNKNENIQKLDEDFYELGLLFNRLMNEKYDGKKIKFINIYLYSIETYEAHPILPMNAPYHYNGHLKFYGTLDFEKFYSLTFRQKKELLWEKCYEYLKECAEFLKNEELLDAVSYAYQKGLDLNLNPDFRIVDKETTLNGEQIRASVWINFKENGWYASLTVEKDGIEVFQKEIDSTKKGVEVFFDIFKKIEFKNDTIIVNGRKEVGYLPLKIPFSLAKI